MTFNSIFSFLSFQQNRIRFERTLFWRLTVGKSPSLTNFILNKISNNFIRRKGLIFRILQLNDELFSNKIIIEIKTVRKLIGCLKFAEQIRPSRKYRNFP